MSADVVQAKYDELDTIARQFGQQAQGIGELRNQLQRSAQPLEQGGWQGRGSAAFFREMSGQVVPATQRLRQRVLRGSTTMRFDELPYIERVADADQYAYFRRFWFFEGDQGVDGRTGVVIFSQAPDGASRHWVCVDQWRDSDWQHPVTHEVLVDQPLPLGMFERIFSTLLGNGVLELGTPDRALTTAHLADVVAVRTADGRENSYSILGYAHLDERHNRTILELFLGPYGLRPYLNILNRPGNRPRKRIDGTLRPRRRT